MQQTTGWWKWALVALLVAFGAMMQRAVDKPQVGPYEVLATPEKKDSLIVTHETCR